MSTFKRYSKKSSLNTQPRIIISERDTDVYVEYTATDKLENLANETYGDPSLWWIIMMANPQYVMEYEIEVGEVIRIPLPLNSVVNEIKSQNA